MNNTFCGDFENTVHTPLLKLTFWAFEDLHTSSWVTLVFIWSYVGFHLVNGRPIFTLFNSTTLSSGSRGKYYLYLYAVQYWAGSLQWIFWTFSPENSCLLWLKQHFKSGESELIHSAISRTRLSLRVAGGAAADPSCHWARGRVS